MRKTVKVFLESFQRKKQLYSDLIFGGFGTRSKHFHNFFIFCLFLCFVLLAVINYDTSALAAQTNNHIDAILVMDTSGSMNGSDRERVSIEAAKMFVDMMDTNGSRVGMLGFSDTITPRIMISDVSSQADKEMIKKSIDDFAYQGYTDLGMALKQARFIYENAPKSENSPVVLLLTDGNIELDDTNTERTYVDSIQDINDVIKDTEVMFPVYTIGLNSNGSVDESLLQNISKVTGGRCYITSSPKDLPAIFNEIFSDHIKSSIINVDLFLSDGLSYKDVTIHIPDDNVKEANIIIFSEKELIDASITAPNGVPIEAVNSDKVLFSRSSKYSIIKLLRPAKGDWILSVNGQKEDLIKVNLLFDYELYVNMSVSPQADLKEGTTLKVEAELATNSADAIDPSLLDIFNMYFVITDNYGNELEIIKLTPVASNSRFETTYTISKELSEKNQQLTVYCTAKSDRVSRESQRTNLTLTKEFTTPKPDSENTQQLAAPPLIKSVIKDISVIYVPVLYGKAEINLANYFENAESYTVSNSAVVSANINDGKLTLTPKANGNDKITVTAANSSMETVSLSFSLSTYNILPYALIVYAILVIAVLTYFIKKSNKLNNTLYTGSIAMVAIDSTGSCSPPELIDLSFTTGVTDLRSIAQDIDNNTLPLEKILIYPGFDEKGFPLIGVINKSNCSITSDFDTKITDRKFMWYNSLSLRIKNENNAGASVLELEYRQ